MQIYDYTSSSENLWPVIPPSLDYSVRTAFPSGLDFQLSCRDMVCYEAVEA